MGPPSLAGPGGRVVRIASAKAAGLLWYLIVNRQVHARDRLAGMFWPEASERRAQASLRTALYELRRALGPEASTVLLVDRTRVGMAPDAAVDADVAVIEAVASLEGASPEDAMGALEAAVAAYGGPFLDGVSFPGACDVDDWLFLERERLANLYATALCRLAEAQGARANLTGAIDLCRRLLAVDPLREDVHRSLMRYLAQSGQRTAALAQYAACAELLRTELDVEPLAATTELYEQIRDNRPLGEEPRHGPGPLARAAARVAGAPEAVREQGRPSGCMVGRSSELGALDEEWHLASAGAGRLVAVEGEAGVGKTRLLAELLTHLPGQALVLVGRCHESTVAEPYGPLIDAVRAVLPGLDLQALELAPVWMREIARLVPELQGELALSGSAPLDGVRDRERLFEGVRAFLAALGRLGPVCLVVEDAHWSDDTSLNLLSYLTREPRPERLLVVVTFRGEELGGRRQLVRRLAQSGRHLVLAPFSQLETAELVGQLSLREPPERFGRALHRATGGNPFFIVETLRAMFEQGTLEEGADGWSTGQSSAADEYQGLPIPESVGLIVSARLDRLGDDARHLLECAAVLRRDFEFDLAAAVSRLPAGVALDCLDDLLGSGLLRELPGETGAASAGYDFAHALVRDHVYQGLSAARRQYVHRQIAGLLEASVPPQADRVAYHYLRGGVRDRACLWSLRAGETALGLYAGEAALVHFRSALEIAVSPAEELAALSGLGDAFVGLGRHAEAVRAFTAALGRAQDAETQADLYRRVGRAQERQGAFDLALEAFGQARQALAGQPLSLTSIRIADSLATVYVRLGRNADAVDLCRDALRWLEQHPDVEGRRQAEAWLDNTMGMALMHAGDFDAALSSLDASLTLKRELGDRLGEATLRNNLGVVLYHQGDDSAARQHYLASLEIKTAIGDTYGRAIALTNLALAETHLGQHQRAGALLDDARSAARDSGAAWLEPEIERVDAERHLALGDMEAAMSCALASLAAAESLGVPSFIGVAHRVLGLAKARSRGEAAEAEEHFMTSLAVFEMLQNDHELAKTQATYGEALLLLGRAKEAAPHLRAAADVFARSGATGRLARLPKSGH
jgi:DNA-binding SARP family transcriptional activator